MSNNYKINGIVNFNDRDVEIKYNHINNSNATIVAIGGTGGGFYGPANIYDFFVDYLEHMNLSMLRVNVFPDHLEGVSNVKIALEFLKKHNGDKPVILMGWSMGGATMIHIAKYLQDTNMFNVKKLIILAGQSYGAEPISQLNNIPVVIIHGTEDKCLSDKVGKHIYKMANNPKKIILLDGASHWMSEQFELLANSIYNDLIN